MQETKRLMLVRIVQMLKLFHLVLVIRMLTALQVLLKSIMAFLRSLIWIGLLLTLVFAAPSSA